MLALFLCCFTIGALSAATGSHTGRIVRPARRYRYIFDQR
jgi:hypothetical protein